MIFMTDYTNFSVMTYLMRTTGLLTQPEKAVHPNDTTTSASISAGQSAETKPSSSFLTRGTPATAAGHNCAGAVIIRQDICRNERAATSPPSRCLSSSGRPHGSAAG